MPLMCTSFSGSARGFGRGISTALYAFTSHTFTTAGLTGRTGPTLAQTQSAYSGASWAQNTLFFNNSNGVQIWTVPEDASYQFTVAAARGATGASGTTPGGSGAIISGIVYLSAGTLLNIVVGQIGIDGTSAAGRGGGGGGGSFVYTGAIAGNGLIFAAGGGGGGDDLSPGPGQAARSDLKPTLTGGTVQLNNGLGGVGSYSDGAGWLGVGATYPGSYDGAQWLGGLGNTIGVGGFGGAGGDIDDGGSGGGFTGGSGNTGAGGGSGGSFYAGMVEPDTTYTSTYIVSNYSWQGLNSSSGYVAVTKV